jgi:SAM-dependent methyltransferase
MIREMVSLYRYHHSGSLEFANHDYHNAFLKLLNDLEEINRTPPVGASVLDLGCGQRFPNSLLFAAKGMRVTALDVNVIAQSSSLKYLFSMAKKNGIKRALMSLTRGMLFDRQYYSTLEQIAGNTLLSKVSDIKFISAEANGSSYPLEDSAFDLVISNAVLEHVKDVEMYFSEVARLLKPNGTFYGIVHNYYSLSGGHNLQWAFPDTIPPKDVPAWDHLRKDLYPTHVYLNKLLPEEYKQAAQKHLELIAFEPRNVNHDRTGYEGEVFLTDDIRQELAEYDRELLLTRAYCIIARR